MDKIHLLHNTYIMYNSVWYASLTKPFLQLPAWIFSPIWIILYTSLLVSLILYAIKITSKKKAGGYIVFVVHMIFNLLWSPIFFYLQRIDIALFVIAIMDLTAINMIIKFFSVSKTAGAILIPYLIWIFFATYLNTMFLILN